MSIKKEEQERKAIQAYFNYVEIEILRDSDLDAEAKSTIQKQLKEAYTLIENNKLVDGFELLSNALIAQFIILNRAGIQLVKEIIALCDLDEAWEYDLRRIISLGYIFGTWDLVDAEEILQVSQYTFYKPSQEITKMLKVGDAVRLMFEFDSSNQEHPAGERMWVEIIEKKGEKYRGILDNDPFYLHELYAGDEISFKDKHIIGHNLEVEEVNLPAKYAAKCMVTNNILYGNEKVGLLYREEPMNIEEEGEGYEDSGWRILTGNESEEYLGDSENISVVSLGSVLDLDDSFLYLLETEVGIAFERNKEGEFEEIVENETLD